MEVEEVKVVDVKVGAALTASSSEASAVSSPENMGIWGVRPGFTGRHEVELLGVSSLASAATSMTEAFAAAVPPARSTFSGAAQQS